MSWKRNLKSSLGIGEIRAKMKNVMNGNVSFHLYKDGAFYRRYKGSSFEKVWMRNYPDGRICLSHCEKDEKNNHIDSTRKNVLMFFEYWNNTGIFEVTVNGTKL